jgi:hypothetical protein
VDSTSRPPGVVFRYNGAIVLEVAANSGHLTKNNWMLIAALRSSGVMCLLSVSLHTTFQVTERKPWKTKRGQAYLTTNKMCRARIQKASFRIEEFEDYYAVSTLSAIEGEDWMGTADPEMRCLECTVL